MGALDWAVLLGTLALIVGYGVWRTRGPSDAGAFLKGGEDARWWTIGLSIMATQASAITFLSTPGQGFEDGLSFVQFYFGVPLAMVFLSATIVPLYYRTRVYTAYEYLEQRFDLKTRQLTAGIFLLQRGLGAGLSLYAPAIILSAVLGWPLLTTNAVLGLVVIAYTVSGGTRAVNQTQQLQMAVMLGGMALALGFVVASLPAEVSVGDALAVAGTLGKLKAVDLSVDPQTRYTLWSGLLGGTFVALAYFGTDQSQVQRYLSGESLAQSRLGLLFNGLLKVPMQLLILLVGVLVFVFFQFHPPPAFFDRQALAAARASPVAARLAEVEAAHREAFEAKRAVVDAYLQARHRGDQAGEATTAEALRAAQARSGELRKQARALVLEADPRANPKDSDHVFLSFVMAHFPPGLVGLLLAVILCAAMSATAGALSALATTSVVDFHRRSFEPGVSGARVVRLTRLYTAGWGLVAVGFAVVAGKLDNLIQATNILGSVFYGPMLGVFLVGFFFRRVRGSPVFWATLLAQALVLAAFALSELGFLWYNVIGCAAVVLLALALERGWPRPTGAGPTPPPPASTAG